GLGGRLHERDHVGVGARLVERRALRTRQQGTRGRLRPQDTHHHEARNRSRDDEPHQPHSTPRYLKRNEKISASSSIIFETGFPAPCPALVSTRMRTGEVPLPAAWSRAANFLAMPGETRSSVSAVVIRI